MPQLMPNTGQGTLSFQDIMAAIDRFADKMVPPSFDPSTPESAVRTGPGVGQSMDIAKNEGHLAGIANLAKFAQMGRGGVGDPSVTARSLLSRFRPKLPGQQRPPTIRDFRQQGIQEPPPNAYAQEIMKQADAGNDITIPYQAGGEGGTLLEGAGAHAARLSPSREFAPGAWEEILKNAQAGGLDEKRQMLHQLYNQFLDSALYGSTHN
jgi:hypothetical protein